VFTLGLPGSYGGRSLRFSGSLLVELYLRWILPKSNPLNIGTGSHFILEGYTTTATFSGGHLNYPCVKWQARCNWRGRHRMQTAIFSLMSRLPLAAMRRDVAVLVI
jgi:hypothetical protein